MSMKIIHPTPMGAPLSEDEVKTFLTSKMNMQLATIDERGDPSIQPVWYYHDPAADRIYVNTGRESHKARNISRKGTVYFSIDEDSFSYRCVKGKARAVVSEYSEKNVQIAEKIMEKYLGSTDHPLAKQILETVRNGSSVLIGMTPAYYSTWDFGKQ
jgi:nitroimidazol reductase NimA-like FMN-containing flavoprotein (pyridoxamine 5'-phosphate oxidase superfamily)